FFSAGFEGAMIVLAAVYIVFESIRRLIAGPKLENLGAGALLVLAAGLINGALGGYLVWVGKRHGSLILEADGRHVLTDCLTSFGVLAGLSLTMLTGWPRFDPMVAVLVAVDILWMGSKLIRQSIGGLMDIAMRAARIGWNSICSFPKTHLWNLLMGWPPKLKSGSNKIRRREPK
ncbi:MAG: cation diffusion facilitator family transporter, partial [Terriglobia bacterium]